jgi:chemotaxis signal transduction protein
VSLTPDALRAAFDREFGEPHPPEARDKYALILVGVGGERYAIAVDAISAIQIDARVGPVPSTERGLCGLATVRNAILPVYDLGVALGHRAQAVAGRWIVIARGDVPIAWSFDTMEGQIRIEPPEGGAVSTIDVAGVPRRVIDLEELRHAA